MLIEEEVKRAKDLHKKNLTYKEIANALNISQNKAYRMVNYRGRFAPESLQNLLGELKDQGLFE